MKNPTSLSYYVHLLVLLALCSCDAIFKTEPKPKPEFPNAFISALKYENPSGAEMISKVLVADKLWEVTYTTDIGKTVLIIDDFGEVLYKNTLLGTTEKVPTAIYTESVKLANAQRGTISRFYKVKSDFANNNGYRLELTIPNQATQFYNFYDSSTIAGLPVTITPNAIVSVLLLNSINQVETKAEVPANVKKFFAQNKFSVDASVSIYVFQNKLARIQLVAYQKDDTGLGLSQILLDADGSIIEWIIPMQKEIKYELLSTAETEAIASQIGGLSSVDFGMVEKQYELSTQQTIRAINKEGKTTWIVRNEVNKEIEQKTAKILTLSQLPQKITMLLDKELSNYKIALIEGIWSDKTRTYQKYKIELTNNAETYIVIFDADGNKLYQYSK